MTPSVPDWSFPWVLHRGLLWAHSNVSCAYCVFARNPRAGPHGGWQIIVAYVPLGRHEDTWAYGYQNAVDFGYQSVDGVPLDIHAIDDPSVRSHAITAFLESCGRLNEPSFDPSTLP